MPLYLITRLCFETVNVQPGAQMSIIFSISRNDTNADIMQLVAVPNDLRCSSWRKIDYLRVDPSAQLSRRKDALRVSVSAILRMALPALVRRSAKPGERHSIVRLLLVRAPSRNALLQP